MLIVLGLAVVFTVALSLLIVLTVDRRRSRYVAALAKKYRMTFVGGDDGSVAALPFPLAAPDANPRVENLVRSADGAFGWNHRFDDDATTYSITCAAVSCPGRAWEPHRLRPSDAAPEAIARHRGLLDIELHGDWLLAWSEGHESEAIFTNLERARKISAQL